MLDPGKSGTISIFGAICTFEDGDFHHIHRVIISSGGGQYIQEEPLVCLRHSKGHHSGMNL